MVDKWLFVEKTFEAFFDLDVVEWLCKDRIVVGAVIVFVLEVIVVQETLEIPPNDCHLRRFVGRGVGWLSNSNKTDDWLMLLLLVQQ